MKTMKELMLIAMSTFFIVFIILFIITNLWGWVINESFTHEALRLSVRIGIAIGIMAALFNSIIYILEINN